MADIAEPPGSLTLSEVYEFDARGYITIPTFISATEVARLNDLIDAHHRAHNVTPATFPLLPVHQVFWDLMTHPKIVDIAKYWCGDQFRVDHIYGFQQPPAGTPGDTGENLHGGPWANQGMFQYHWYGGKSRVGLLVFTIVLESVGPGEGGLMIVPGSHKSNVPLEGREVWTQVVKQSHANMLTVQPVLNAGDLMIFTESLVHGTSRWKNSQRRRRNLYYKYCPGHVSWRDYAEFAGPMRQLARTDLQRSLLRPAYVGRYKEDEATMYPPNYWRPPTGTQE